MFTAGATAAVVKMQHTQRSSLGVEAVACYRCRPIGVHLREMGHTIKINSTGSNLCRY